MKIVTEEEMRTLEQYTINDIGIAANVLMERAALAIADVVCEGSPRKVLAVIGNGNNGGDGIAAARILLERHIQADVLLQEGVEHLHEEALSQYNSFDKKGGETVLCPKDMEYDVIIDAMFGIGLKREVTGEWKNRIEWMNQCKESGVKIVAVDIPSGIHTDTGAICNVAVRADVTVTFEFMKRGHYLYPGAEYCGKIRIAPIGIDHKESILSQVRAFTYHNAPYTLLPKRKRDGNKGSNGRVLVIAGSNDMNGACYLSALAAYRTGAGLIMVHTAKENRTLIQTMLPEAIVSTFLEEGEEKFLGKEMAKANCVVLGPGLSTCDEAKRITMFVVKNCNRALVIDADALNCIAMEKELLYNQKRCEERPIVITPHPGELSRLTGQTIEELKKDYPKSVSEIAEKYAIIAVGKGAGSIVSNGEDIYINHTGNDGMATAGSGDVLAGMVGSLIATGMPAFDAACLGVYLHGKAGDFAANRGNRYSLMARDIAEAIKDVISLD